MTMYQEDYEMFTGDDAMTIAEIGSFTFEKYRAVQVVSEEMSLHPSEQQYFVPHYEVQDQKNLFQSVRFTPNSSSCIPTSRCPEKPCFTSPNSSFYVHEGHFDKVKESIERALEAMEDYDWSYFESDCLWKVKYFQGSNYREQYIYCYWDSKSQNHLIEVKRVQGDGLMLKNNFSDFLNQLKAAFHQPPSSSGQSQSKRNGLRTPLPFPEVMRSGFNPFSPLTTLHNTQTGVTVTEEQFLSGIKPILSMARDAFYEPRLEAAKMLCDLATKEPKYLELADCQELCLQSLESLLFDEFEEVRQFAVMAFASFAEVESYRSLFLRLRGLESLLALIRNSPREYPAYQTAQMRRKAALGMSLLATSHPQAVKQRLMNVGYETEQSWRDHCCSILDKRTREAAMKIVYCYHY